MNTVSEKVKAISTKGLTKDLTKKYTILKRAKYFYSGILQYLFVFRIATLKYIKYFSGTTWIDWWKSDGMSKENIENITKWDSNFASFFVNHQPLPDINFNGYCLINKNTPILKKLANLYISYILSLWLRNLNTD